MNHPDTIPPSRSGRSGAGFRVVAIVFAVYALAVALSLFLFGHLSDWHGRRRVLIAGLGLLTIAVWLPTPSLSATPTLLGQHATHPSSQPQPTST
jgi:MFS family permease